MCAELGISPIWRRLPHNSQHRRHLRSVWAWRNTLPCRRSMLYSPMATVSHNPRGPGGRVNQNTSLLTTDLVTRRLIGVSRETMAERLKSLQILPKVLARRTNPMWDILLACEEDGKKLSGSVLTTKSSQLKTEYTDTRKTRERYTGCP